MACAPGDQISTPCPAIWWQTSLGDGTLLQFIQKIPGWPPDSMLIFGKCSSEALCISKHIFSIKCNRSLA